MYWLGKGVILEQALVQYTMKRAIEFGFSPVSTPELVKSSIIEKCGFRPRPSTSSCDTNGGSVDGENGPEPSQIYVIESGNSENDIDAGSSSEDPLCLIGTSEIPLTAMYSDEVLGCYDASKAQNMATYAGNIYDSNDVSELKSETGASSFDTMVASEIPDSRWFGKGQEYFEMFKDHLRANFMLDSSMSLGAKRNSTLATSSSGKPQVLPVAMVGISKCFRSEAGSRGKDTKGLYRLHNFQKLELVVISDTATSHNALDFIVSFEKVLFEELGLAIRILNMPTAELGASSYCKFDIEAKFPARTSGYGEISSASNCTDYQTRRLNIKYKPPHNQIHNNSKLEFAHSLNGTACAISRVVAAILENNQSHDGSYVNIPKVLWPYTMGLTRI
ncbi:Serine-tRNA ligase, mitochondrial [Smittium culicis]|uniref:serine--tRNA ligase n=1 Tax=Smittium culicis TaxID=133412 RepID=A0A1R1X0H4_9FUNG|nr:Serine-tRNA ligase, mitochondrial [Smittium culicis]